MSGHKCIKFAAAGVVASAAFLAGCSSDTGSGDVFSSAVSADDAFIATLEDAGLDRYYGVDSEAIGTAHLVCDALDVGASVMDVTMTAVESGFAPYDAGFFVGASVASYCPEYSGDVQDAAEVLGA